MVKAVFLDFYGTVVHEDGAVIEIINERIFKSGEAENKCDIGNFWWDEFSKMFLDSHGESFQTQRELEYKSLEKTIRHFNSTEDAKALSTLMFEHWNKPPIFEESKKFFKCCPVPIFIVSNIDTADIKKAIDFHGLFPKAIFTSEDACSYKPRKEIFEMALINCGFQAEDVLHIGDSINSDIKGACALGINTIWLNRFKKDVPSNILAVSNLLDIFDTKYFK